MSRLKTISTARSTKQALDELIEENPDDQFYKKLLSEYKEMN